MNEKRHTEESLVSIDEHHTEESLVSIDEHHLDRECAKLPTDCIRWSCRVADLRREMDSIKAELDVIEADLGRQIRALPGKFGIEKLTEDCLKSTVKLQKPYRDQLTKLQNIKHELELASAVVDALDTKKASLKMMVDLHAMGYFSEVRPKDGKQTLRNITMARVKPIARKRTDDDED